MSKEMTPKEAWNGLLNDIKVLEFFTNETKRKEILSKIDIIRPYITPPTADEVCKALNYYFGFDYYYQDGYFYKSDGTKYIYPIKANGYSYKSDGTKYIYPIKVSGFIEIQMFDGHLPPHLITLIGRFYEGLEAHNVG